MSYEAHFKLSSNVAKQNSHGGPTNQPWSMRNRSTGRVSPYRPVWQGGGIIGPYFFNQTVNTTHHIQILNEFILPKLPHCCCLSCTRFQQVGTTCHCAGDMSTVLQNVFYMHVISCGTEIVCPPHMLDLTVPDFFLRRYLNALFTKLCYITWMNCRCAQTKNSQRWNLLFSVKFLKILLNIYTHVYRSMANTWMILYFMVNFY